MYIIHNNKVVNKETGEVISHDISPKFSGISYENYSESYPNLRYIQPMTCKEIPKDQVKDFPIDGYIAEEKYDGFRNILQITKEGNRAFSRDISLKSNWFGECSDNIPHIRDAKLNKMIGTIFDSEATLPTEKFKDIAGVMGSNTLQDTALKNQVDKGFASLNVFDIPYYKGLRIENYPLWRRKIILHRALQQCDHASFKEVPIFCNNKTYKMMKEEASKLNYKIDGLNIEIRSSFKELLEEKWADGKEGLILKNIFGVYEQKKSGLFLKLKDMFYRDVIVMGFNPPTMDYEGKTLDEKGYWDYWIDYDDPDAPFEKRLTVKEMQDRNCAAVSKPYAMGWIGSIRCGVWKDGELVEVANIKGIKEDLLIKISKNEDAFLGKVLEIKFNEFNEDDYTPRHPRFSKINDKPSKECTWETWING